METLFFEKIKEIKKEKANLEKKLRIEIKITGRQVAFSGNPIDEYASLPVLEAMQFGFSAKKSMQLIEDNYIFRRINIKDFTKRKDLHQIRARIIGMNGKTKHALENISDSDLIVRDDNTVGIISSSEKIDAITTAITKIIKGSKQANVYNYLERMNAERKKFLDDLGIKEANQKQ